MCTSVLPFLTWVLAGIQFGPGILLNRPLLYRQGNKVHTPLDDKFYTASEVWCYEIGQLLWQGGMKG